ncbi:MAG: MSEP-CTERM sorting domain-containing protein [Bacteroidetes bacterium]|nr:MSEP-CTERM sorting domain-containing protein [Bacteroidota bacterium]
MNKAQQPKWAILLSVIPVLLFFAITLQLFYTDQSKPIYTFEDLLSILIGAASYLIIIIPYVIYKIKRKSYISLSAFIFILTFSVLEVFFFIHFELLDILDNGNVFGITLPVNETMLFLLIPGCFYSLFGIVVLLNKTENKDAGRSIAFVIAIPLFYAFVLLIFSDINTNRLDFIPDIFSPILIVVSVLFVVYHMLRASYLSYNKNKSESFITSPPFVMFFGVFMPLLGLVLNGADDAHYFGNFSSYWYFILAILNGLLLAIPFGNNLTLRIVVFVARSILFAFTIYFFIVFLPYAPLSVVLIAAVGAGLLMLTPILLFIIHCQVLINDIAYLKNYIGKPYLRAILICCLFVIPVTMHQQLAANKKEMLTAIDYLDNPNYEKNATINLTKTIKAFKVKQSYPGFLSGRTNKNGTPIISWYFNTIILDSKTISINKGAALKSILLNSEPPTVINEPLTTDNVKLDQHLVASSFDPATGYWTSNVQLFFQAPDSTNQGWNNQLEYFSVFDLPTAAT